MCSNRTFIILALSICCYGIFSSLMSCSRSLKCVQLDSTTGEPGPQNLGPSFNIECLNLLRAHASCALKYHSLCLLNSYIISTAMIRQRTFGKFIVGPQSLLRHTDGWLFTKKAQIYRIRQEDH